MGRKGGIRWIGPIVAGVCLLAVLIFMLIGLGDTGAGGDEHGPDATGGNPGLQKVRIVLTSYPHAGHAFLFAAEAKGYLREQGRILEPVVAGTADVALRMVDEGKADLALVSQPDVLLARNEGRRVVSIAAIVREPLVYMMVPRDSPIHHPAHLAGKTVAMLSGSPVHDAVLTTMLDSVRGSKPEVSIAALDGRPADLLRDGRADALLGPTILDGRRSLAAAGVEVRVIEPMLYGVPPYYETVLVAGEQAVEEEQETVAGIWTALVQGYEYVAEQPEEAVTLLLRAGVFDGNPEWSVFLDSLRLQLPFMRTGADPFGSQDKQAWKDTEKWLTDLDLLDFTLDADDAFVNLPTNLPE